MKFWRYDCLALNWWRYNSLAPNFDTKKEIQHFLLGFAASLVAIGNTILGEIKTNVIRIYLVHLRHF